MVPARDFGIATRGMVAGFTDPSAVLWRFTQARVSDDAEDSP
jgi:hypothetical protein